MSPIIKAITVLLIAFSLTACASNTAEVKDHIGAIEEEQLLTTFSEFNHKYHSFTVTELQLDQAKLLPDDLVIDIYFGTWCHDSVREVPRLLKALKANPEIQLNLFALDYQKLDPEGRAEQAGVKFTPTFIVSREGKELGRIIERPKVDLVSDIVGFVQ